MIIGLTGPNSSGKGEVAEYLRQKGFYYFSLSDVVREEAVREGLDSSRENLIKVGNDLRIKHGSGILAKRVREKIQGDAVVDSIRNPSEIMELRKEKDFFLLGIDAPIHLRFRRSQERGRLGDGSTLETFQKREDMENSTDPVRQQLEKCMKMADFIIVNDASLEILHNRIDRFLFQLKKNKV